MISSIFLTAQYFSIYAFILKAASPAVTVSVDPVCYHIVKSWFVIAFGPESIENSLYNGREPVYAISHLDFQANSCTAPTEKKMQGPFLREMSKLPLWPFQFRLHPKLLFGRLTRIWRS